jgi:plastocyanin
MFSTRFAFLGSLTFALTIAASAAAQDTGAASATPAAGPHTIVIKLVERGGPVPYAFEPSNFSAHQGDTLRFVQMASTMHNVHFTSVPKGAKLGSAAESQYLTTKGTAYTLVVDARFVPGKYEIVCDPHAAIGMHAFLSVDSDR